MRKGCKDRSLFFAIRREMAAALFGPQRGDGVAKETRASFRTPSQEFEKLSFLLPFAGRMSRAYSFHFISERSLTKIGAFFHRPSTLALATVTLGSWNRKAFTLSSASFFCASPSAAL